MQIQYKAYLRTDDIARIMECSKDAARKYMRICMDIVIEERGADGEKHYVTWRDSEERSMLARKNMIPTDLFILRFPRTKNSFIRGSKVRKE